MAVVVVAIGFTFGLQDKNLPSAATDSAPRQEQDFGMKAEMRNAPRRAPSVAIETPAPTVTAPPVVTPAPVASSVARAVNASRQALADLVASYFPDAPIFATHIVWAESMGDWAGDRWVCYVYGPCVSPTGDRGLMQINQIHAGKFAAHGWNYWTDAYDPVKNLVIAREIYDAQGCQAWASC